MFNLLITPLGAFLSSYVGLFAARGLMGLGIGVISYSAIAIALELFYTQAQGYYDNIPAFSLQIINLTGHRSERSTGIHQVFKPTPKARSGFPGDYAIAQVRASVCTGKC